MKLQKNASAAGVLVLAMTSTVCAQQTPVVAAASAATPAAKPPASAGLINDLLRAQSPAWSAWDLGGQFRLRYEDKENAGSFPNNDFISRGVTNSNDYLLLREKVHLGWTPEPWLKFYVEGRNSTSDFDQRRPSPDSDQTDLQQAFIVLGDAKQFPVTAKVGRQELVEGDERFVGKSDWSNTGRVFDAGRLRFEHPTFAVDAFSGRMVLPYDNRFNLPNNYDWFSGLYASTQKLAPWQDTQLYFLARNISSGSAKVVMPTATGTAARDVYTLGTLWKSIPDKLGGWDYALEAAGQFGSVNSRNPGGASGFRHDLQAFGVWTSVGYTWKQAWGTPRLGVGYDFGSGDDNPADATQHTFENLYGTTHSLYGQMDLLGLRNSSSPNFSASLKPVKGLTLKADYYLFWMVDTHDYLYPESASARSKNGYGIHPAFDSFVGSELDLVATYAYQTYGDLQAGFAHFFVGDYLQQSVASVAANGGAVDANWIFVQARFNF